MGNMDPSNLEQSKLPIVHGISIGNVSPIKVSHKSPDKKYFETNLSDGYNTVCMVSFEPKLRKVIEDAYKDGCKIAASKCSVKRGLGNTFEVFANHKTEIIAHQRNLKLAMK